MADPGRVARFFPDAPAVLFSLKAFAAMAAAYYAALAIGLDHPTWAVLTAYITAQPLAGGVIGKAVFRLVGTVLSGAVAVALVPRLVNAPELLALALALWLGLCVFVAALDRAPRAYIFLMSGYTVSIIAFPTLNAPQGVFDYAAFRVQEIGIGIVSAAFFHGAILPVTVTGRLLARIRETVADAERWSADALARNQDDRSTAERRRMAVDLDDMRQLAANLPFDTARLMPRPATVGALRDQLMQILPLAAAVEDRAGALAAAGALAPPVAALLDEARGWLADGAGAAGIADEAGPAPDIAAADAIAARAIAARPALGAPLLWHDALAATLLARLAELVVAHRNVRVLVRQIASPDAVFRRSAVPLIAHRRWRAMHVDWAGALRSGAGATLAMLLAMAFWIATAWPAGASAALFAGVVCALFGTQDDPRPAVKGFLLWLVAGLLVGVLMAFAVLPRVTALPLLLLVLAPVLLPMGVAMASPATAQRGTGFMIGVVNSVGLDLRYDADFAALVNGDLGLLLGSMLAVVVLGFTKTSGVAGSVDALIAAGWRDLARRSDSRRPPDIADWVARMVDRVGLLTPRLQALGRDPGKPMLDVLTDMRTGVNVRQLRALRLADAADEPAITPVLQGVARHFRTLDPAAPVPPPPALLAAIDRALGVIATAGDPARREEGVTALAGLRRNLFPDAAGFVAHAGQGAAA